MSRMFHTETEVVMLLFPEKRAQSRVQSQPRNQIPFLFALRNVASLNDTVPTVFATFVTFATFATFGRHPTYAKRV